MTGRLATYSTPDFRALDFEELWKGRSKTTYVEKMAILRLLAACDRRRLLEIGSGGGRLTPMLRANAREFIASDVTPEFVQGLPRSLVAPPSALRVTANVDRLPFVDGSISCAVMIRVYNFLPDPETALKEIRRVLAPGGRLILSCDPKPSLATLVGDLRVVLSDSERPFHSETFSHGDLVRVHPSPFPAWAPTRLRLVRTLNSAGFAMEKLLGTGLEDYRPLKQLPVPVFLGLLRAFDVAPRGIFPTLFVSARSTLSGEPTHTLPPFGDMLGCPNCRSPLGSVSLGDDWERGCPKCGQRMSLRNGSLESAPSEDSPSPNL